MNRVWPHVAGAISLVLVPLAYVTSDNLGVATGGLFEHRAWVRPVEFGGLGVALVVDVGRAFRK